MTMDYLVKREVLNMIINFTPMTTDEFRYAAKQSTQISGQTGFIGHLNGILDTENNFLYGWTTYRRDLRTEDFVNEFEDLYEELKNGVLASLSNLNTFCINYKGKKVTDFGDLYYGTTVKLDDFTHLIVFYGNKVTIHSYKTDWLYQHIEQASRGIKFITPDYDIICRIKDGDNITIQNQDGTTENYVCRYIDDHHTEINGMIYHICEFAELLEKGGRKVIVKEVTDLC